MRVEHIGAAADVEHDEVAVGLVDGKARRQRPGDLVHQAISRVRHHAVGDGQDGFAVDAVTAHLPKVAADEPVLSVDPFPIDREALRQPEHPTDRQERADVTGRIAASICGDVACAA